VLPPASGNDNPQHYDDSACCRAVPIGLAWAGDPEEAAAMARLDAQITNAEDGVYAAQAVAAAISLLAAGAPLAESLAQARAFFPPGSWIAHNDGVAQDLLAQADTPQDLLLLLQTGLINTVYSYGNAAPETLPAAFAIVTRCAGDLQQAVTLANAIPKAADSLPALVGALCGAYQGAAPISPRWRDQLNPCRGICLPFLQGIRLDETAQALVQRAGELSALDSGAEEAR
jgi:ADP-ribosylglycohydrolase